MGKFEKYGERLNDLAQDAFAKYREAELACQKAEQRAKEYPQRFGMIPAEYELEHLTRKAEMKKQKENLRRASDELQARNKDVEKLRGELERAVRNHYAVDPADVDSNALELLKSGMCDVDDFTKLMNKARTDRNFTMQRYISRYARDAVESAPTKEAQQTLREIAGVADLLDGSDILAKFDVGAFAFRQTTQNPLMIDDWRSLTEKSLSGM